MEIVIIVCFGAIALYNHFKCQNYEKLAMDSIQMCNDMINGGSDGLPEDMGYMWLTQNNERVWTKFQPKYTSMIYMSKKDYLDLIGGKK